MGIFFLGFVFASFVNWILREAVDRKRGIVVVVMIAAVATAITALVALRPELPDGAGRATAMLNLSDRGDLVEAAANLFACLRRLDASGARTIAVAPIPETGLGEAINDRLRRAAAERI